MTRRLQSSLLIWLAVAAGLAGCKRHQARLDLDLVKAVSSGDVPRVEIALRHGANVETRFQDATPLILAAGDGHTEVVRLLLDHGANIEARDSAGRTALIESVIGPDAVAKLLIDRGANVEARDDNDETALTSAAERGNVAVARLLLPRVTSEQEKNRALCAAAHGIPVAVVMISPPPGPKRQAAAPEIPPSLGPYAETIDLLLDDGADIETRDKEMSDGGTPLILAATFGETEALRELLRRGARVDARDKDGSTALLAAACDCAIIDMPDTFDSMKLLLEKNADANARANNGVTPLIAATGWGRTENMQLLLDHGAGLEAGDQDGNTALLIASSPSALDLAPAAKLLIARHANVEARNKSGDTPLIQAASDGNLELVKLLVAHGANRGDQNRHGDSALSLATKNHHADVVRFLRAR